jgi:hypothetical protein
VVDFKKITYKRRADGPDIPAYVFAPLNKRGEKGHAALIWVYGGVHGNWDQNMLPFVKEAVDRIMSSSLPTIAAARDTAGSSRRSMH